MLLHYIHQPPLENTRLIRNTELSLVIYNLATEAKKFKNYCKHRPARPRPRQLLAERSTSLRAWDILRYYSPAWLDIPASGAVMSFSVCPPESLKLTPYHLQTWPQSQQLINRHWKGLNKGDEWRDSERNKRHFCFTFQHIPPSPQCCLQIIFFVKPWKKTL